jgi:hypothetical protein
MSRALSAIACIALLTNAACGSSTEPADPALSSATAERAANVFSRFSLSPQISGAGVKGRFVFACPGGGSIRNAVDNPAPVIEASLIYDRCSVADGGGQLWTFTTLPALAITLTTARIDSALVSTIALVGTFRVESRDVRGTCAIDSRLRFEPNLDAAVPLRIRQTGQVCGQVIDTTWTVTQLQN